MRIPRAISAALVLAASMAAFAAPRVKFADRMLEKGIRLRSEQRFLNPRGVGVSIQHRENKALLGSGTRICLDSGHYFSNRPWNWTAKDERFESLWKNVPSGRDWVITASHVIPEGAKSVLLNGVEEYRVEMLDPGMDLALLSAESSRELRPCAVLADEIRVGMAYDVESAFIQGTHPVAIEAVDPRTGKLFRSTLNSTLTSSFKSGIAGHDETGPLLFAVGYGLLGHSGGGLYAKPDLDGNLSVPYQSPTFSKEATEAGYERLIGMILAIDPDGRQMATLPSVTIEKRLLAHFQKALPAISQETRNVRHAALYLDSGALHVRNSLLSAGTGRFGDGGTGRLGDGGTGRFGDGGTGRFGDASKSRAEARSPGAGIHLNGKRWLSIETDSATWSQYEAAPSSIRDALKDPARLRGVYEDEDGHLFATDAHTALPAFLRHSRQSMRSDFFEMFDLNPDGPKRSAGEDCIRTLALLRESSSERAYGAELEVCQRLDEARQSEITLRLLRTRTRVSPFSAQIRLSKAVPAASGPQAVLIQADFHRESGSHALIPDGFRHFTGPGVQIWIEQYGGYRIELQHGNRIWLIHGPVSLDTAFQLQERFISP